MYTEWTSTIQGLAKNGGDSRKEVLVGQIHCFALSARFKLFKASCRIQVSKIGYLMCTLQPDFRNHRWWPIREIVPVLHESQAGIIPVGLADMGDGGYCILTLLNIVQIDSNVTILRNAGPQEKRGGGERKGNMVTVVLPLFSSFIPHLPVSRALRPINFCKIIVNKVLDHPSLPLQHERRCLK